MTQTEEITWHEPLPRNVPRETYTPAVLALGMVVLCWGFVTSWLLSAAGLVLIVVGVTGWARELVRQTKKAVREEEVAARGHD